MQEVSETSQRQRVPNVVTYNALISACDKGSDPDRASEVFEALRGYGVVPTEVTYSAVISACEKGEQFTRALMIFDEL